MKNYTKTICLYFQVHQPYRISGCNAFEIGNKDEYFEGPQNFGNQAVFEKVAQKCYLPTNALILELLNKHPEFRVSYSFSGVFLEQCQEYGEIGKQVLESFKAIVKTGQVEVLSETYYHSLSWLYSKKEFADQIHKHKELIWKLFRKKPTIFRNTELIYSNEIGEFIREMGFKGMMAEGWDHYLQWRSPNFLHHAHKVDLHPADRAVAKAHSIRKHPFKNLTLLLKNYKLSDDIAFRFSNKGWNEWPLNTEKYADWVDAAEGDTIDLFMDYETFGEHQWEDTGIFDFMRHLPETLLKRNIGFKTPSETIKAYESKGDISVPHLMSWADMERDISAWRSNQMQESALSRVFELEHQLRSRLDTLELSQQEKLMNTWRRLQTSDHFYYMCTKYWSDGDVHAYFSPYESPYDAFIAYMNTLNDFEQKVERLLGVEPRVKVEEKEPTFV